MVMITLTSKGQTTIPKVSIVPLTSDVSELKGLLSKPKKKVSIEDMNKAIAKRGADPKKAARLKYFKKLDT